MLARAADGDALTALPLLSCEADALRAVPDAAAGADGDGGARATVPILACGALIHALRSVPRLARGALGDALRSVPYLSCGAVGDGEAQGAVPVLAGGTLGADGERCGALGGGGGGTAAGAAGPGDDDGAVGAVGAVHTIIADVVSASTADANDHRYGGRQVAGSIGTHRLATCATRGPQAMHCAACSTATGRI